MPISLVASEEAYYVTTATTLPGVNVDTPVGIDRILVVKVALILTTGTMPTVSTVTYGAQSLTKTDGAAANMTVENVDDAQKSRVEIWKIVAPTVGSANVVVTLSAAATAAYIVAEVWTGVDQTTPLGTAATAQSDTTGTSATVTVDVTSAATTEKVIDMMVDYGIVGGVETLTVGAGQTETESQIQPHAGASYKTGAVGAVTMSWTSTTANSVVHNWAIIGVPLKAGGTTSPDVSASTTITEIGVVTHRAAPSGFSVAGTVAENQQAAWAAAGMYPSVFKVTPSEDGAVWDHILMINSVSPAAKIAITSLPTPASPNGSMLVATQGNLVQYPLPYTGVYPDYANGGDDLVPVFYPSPVDLGNDLYKVRYVECYGDDFTQETDAWGYSFRWGNTNAWETAELQYQGYALFTIPDDDGNKGSVLHDAYSIYDSVATDPVGPTGRWVVVWVKKIEGERPYDVNEPVRTTTEVG